MIGSADRWISWTTTGCMAVPALIAATAARELNAKCANEALLDVHDVALGQGSGQPAQSRGLASQGLI